MMNRGTESLYVRRYERVKVEDTRDLLIFPETTLNGYRPIEIILTRIPVTPVQIESIVNRYKIDLVHSFVKVSL